MGKRTKEKKDKQTEQDSWKKTFKEGKNWFSQFSKSFFIKGSLRILLKVSEHD